MSEDIAEIKLAGYFLEWDQIEGEKAKLAERSKDLGKAMKDDGFNAKAARVSFREQRAELTATPQDVAKAEEDEAVLDRYRIALKKGLASRAHPARAREANEYAAAKGAAQVSEPVGQVLGGVAKEPIVGTATLVLSTPAESVSDEISATNSHLSASSSRQANTAGAVEPPPTAPAPPPTHKDGCLDQSGCKVKFTSALCSRCASERAKARVAA